MLEVVVAHVGEQSQLVGAAFPIGWARVFYSLIALPLGAVTLTRFHRANPDLLRRGTA